MTILPIYCGWTTSNKSFKNISNSSKFCLSKLYLMFTVSNILKNVFKFFRIVVYGSFTEIFRDRRRRLFISFGPSKVTCTHVREFWYNFSNKDLLAISPFVVIEIVKRISLSLQNSCNTVVNLATSCSSNKGSPPKSVQ